MSLFSTNIVHRFDIWYFIVSYSIKLDLNSTSWDSNCSYYWEAVSGHALEYLQSPVLSLSWGTLFMSSICGVGVRVCVRVNNFSSKTTRPRDMLFFFKRYLIYRGWQSVQGMQICLFVCLLEPLQGRYPHQKCENFDTLSQFSQWLLQGFLSYLAYMY